MNSHRIVKIVWFVIAGFWLWADQWTKHWAVLELKEKQQAIDVLPVLRWFYVENHGAAFGMLADQGGWQKWAFLAVGAVAIALLTGMIIKMPRGSFFAPFGYASILGGALGNVYDRGVLGYVRDMISVYYEPINFYFAIFNVADVAISVGVGALVIDWLLSILSNKRKNDAA